MQVYAKKAPVPWSRLAGFSGELGGAFDDLGTFRPYVVPALAGGLLLPGPFFAGFAVGYLLVAIIYRVPKIICIVQSWRPHALQ